MTTIFLAAAGNAIAPGFGQFVGAAIGSYIDNTFLFPPPNQKGPRLDSSALNSASEGSPCNFCLGQENRVAGTIIWMGPLIETKKTSGKGGPSQTTYSYKVDLAIEFNEGIAITSFPKLFANGKLLYNAQPNISIASALLSIAVITQVENYGTDTTTTIIFGEITSPNGGPDLSVLQSGKNFTVAGATNANNNGTFKVVSSTKDSITGISKVRYRNQLAVVQSASPVITLTQTLPAFSPKAATSFTFYLGTETQLADPLIQAYEGAANVPGYRGRAYVVIQGLQLSYFGNQLPQLLQAEIQESAAPRTLASAIQLIWARSGRAGSQIDVSAVTGNIRGYTIRGPQSLIQQLRPLLFAYDLLTQEDNGILRVFPRTAASVVTVSSVDLAAHSPGSDTERPFKVDEKADRNLPSEVSITYSDPLLDYQQGSQSDHKNTFSVDSPLQIDLGNLVLSASEARAIARRLLWEAWANKKQYSLKLPISYITVAENDKLSVTVNGRTYRLLTKKIDRGNNFLMEVETVSEQDQILTFTNATADNPSPTTQQLYVPPEMQFYPADIPPLRDDELNIPGYYVGACAYDIETLFQGASLFESTDNVSYTEVKTFLSEANIGLVTSGALGTAVYGYWDNINSLTVTLYEGSLSSASEIDVLNGANRALVGLELIGFKTVVANGNNSYTLSGLLRGQRNTNDVMATHVANERFMLLNTTNMYFREIQQSQINSPKYLKCVSAGGTLADFLAQTMTAKANNLRPFPPVHVKGSRSGTDLTITWVRRTRAPVRMFGGTFTPLAEQDERYEIDILNVAETVVLRTISVSAAQTTTYLGATQTTDGLIAGAAVHLKIYQLSAIVGRGKFTLAVV